MQNEGWNDIEGWGLIEGYGNFIEGHGIAIDLNPLHL